MKKGGWLLEEVPRLKSEGEICGEWDMTELEALCELLKGNAIPTKKLDLTGDRKKKEFVNK